MELVGEWCDGYTIAVELDPKWSADRDEGAKMLLPLAVLADLFSLVGKPNPNNKNEIIKIGRASCRERV